MKNHVIRGGRVVKWKGTVASMAPSLFLASVSVAALSVGMAVADVISSPQNTQAVFNTDEDHTITATGSVDLTTGAGDAVVITDDYSSTFTNDGTISGPATGDQLGIGLLVDGDLEATGQVVNNGSIDIDVNGSSFLAGTGIYLDGQVAGDVVNTGTITVNSDNSSSGPALAFGVDFDSDVEATATVRNSGVISVKASSGSSSRALATGLFFDNDVNTDITNSGTVNATAENASTLSATGLDLSRALYGDINNTGTIQAIAVENGSVAQATGLHINDEAVGNITNSGAISASADAHTSATAFSVQLGSTLTGNFTNTGSLTATAGLSASRGRPPLPPFLRDPTAAALLVDDIVQGDIENRGAVTVSATATDRGSVTASGFHLKEDLNGNFLNSGTVSVSADTTDDNALAYGLYILNDLNGDFANSGSINVTATAPGDDADAYGAYIEDDVDGNIANSGIVDARAVDATSVEVAGFYIDDKFTGNFTNSGSITAIGTDVTGATAEAYGLFVASEMVGDIHNSGTVFAQADGSTDATAAGYYIDDTLNGNFTNSGSLITIATDQTEAARAFGLYVDDDFTGDVSNSGSITSGAVAANLGLDTDTHGALAGAAGFYFDENFDGNFSNSGSISTTSFADNGTSNAFGLAFADGLVVNEDMAGNISNSGTISVSAEGEVSAGASGFHISGQLSGDFSNSGTVSVNGVSRSGGVEAYGLYVGDDSTGDITNSGSVYVHGDGSTDATVGGYYIDGDLNGTFENSGTIVANVTGSVYSAYVAGLVILENLGAGGGILNTGSILSRIENEGLSYVNTRGIFVRRDVYSDIENAGTISAVVTGNRIGSATATGINISGSMNGTLSNSGTISAAADGASYAYANGLAVNTGFVGDLINSGSISATAENLDGGVSATATAIFLGALTGNVENSGTLIATAGGDGSYIDASGIYIFGALDGDFTNSGAIRAIAANAQSSAASTVATGVFIGETSGVITNSGAISATASGAGADAYGLYIDAFDGVITDVGTISATSDNGDAYAIYLGSGSGTLNVDTEDRVTGTMRVAAHDVNLDARGGSNVFFFEDAATDAGTFTTTVSDDGSAWFVEDEGGSNPIYASVDSADMFTSGDVIATYGGLVGSAGQALGYSAPAQVSRSFAFRDSFVNAFRPYAMVDAQAKQFEQSGGSDTDVNILNGSFGFAGQLDNGTALAFGIGVFTADGDSDTTSFDTNAVYLSLAAGRQFGAYTVEADIGVGFLSNDKTREIIGSPDAKGDYESTLYTLSIGVERSFDLQSEFDLLGFGNVRYTRQDDDSYTETDSLANATVGEATTEVIEARLGIEVEKSVGRGGALIGQLSGVLRRDLGEASTDVTVFSTTNSLAFPSTDFTGGSILIGYEKDFVSGLKLEVNAEQEIGDDAQGPFVKAGLKWAF
ncbi:beta strand repeat-containing protein [Ruegeria halocynthiae]|uniref:beta strand repeat-containing protein n=1 Tax=Ruegeria halocynthiae TaxID=985054 RepID=UPI001268EDD6|nr:autotransporter outer membrane beta-barrel domain-containing protein [Ruegeria halocynthiae]